MEEQKIFQLCSQSLAMAHNYINTGRFNKAIEMLSVVKRIEPDNTLVHKFFGVITATTGLCNEPELADEFGLLWDGENLDGKTIEVFCDQGMGDTINMLRYLHVMKSKWNCYIVLNCYAYYQQFKRLLELFPYIDEFVQYHKKCDYQTNVFSLPAILAGIKLPVYYPAHFSLVMEKEVPPQPRISVCGRKLNEEIKVGVAWSSNPDNKLYLIKTIPLDIIKALVSDDYLLYSLNPYECPDFMVKTDLSDLLDTAEVITSLDYVVSVDTVVLHLAGAMGKNTFGLIPDSCDPRWGTEDITVWYPSVKLIRQDKNWTEAVKCVKKSIESLCLKQ